jgi:hypothetical protein
VPPTGTATGFGEYAVVVKVDEPETIETAMDPDGGGVVGGVGVAGEDEPHATEEASSSAT